jgi:two-component system, chemotaxis family, sensor kinase CheA
MAIEKERFLRLFLEEFRENIRSAERDLIGLKNDPGSSDALSSLLRALHTMKGSSRMLQYSSIEKLIHGTESVFKAVKDGRFTVDSRIVRFFFIIADRLRLSCDSLEAGAGEAISDLDDYLVMCEKISANEAFDLSALAKDSPKSETQPALPPKTRGKNRKKAAPHEPEKASPVSISEGLDGTESRPETPGLSTEASIRVDALSIDRAINLVNTLSIRQLRLKSANDELERLEKRLTKFRTETDDVKEIGRRTKELARGIRNFRTAYSEQLFEIQYGTQELRDTVISMRMIPLSTIIDRFPRMVEQTAMDLGKEISLSINGSSVHLDRTVLEKVTDPLIHLIRNAVDHGIESPGLREQTGKARQGSICISCKAEGNRVSISVADDGSGFHYEDIRERAKSNWPDQIDEIKAMSNDELLRFIFKSGFTTKPTATDISGRGIGLDIVKANIESVKGQILIDSRQGEGTTFTLLLPVSASTIDGMFVRAGGSVFFIPAAAIRRTLLLDRDECFRLMQKEVFSLEGMNVPLYDLAVGLKLEPKESSSKKIPVLLIRGPTETVGIAVERILGYDSLVFQPLPASIKDLALVQGIVFDENFSIIPIINMWVLIERLRSVRVMETHKRYSLEAGKSKPMVLVVDDSISTREIEESMLELEGFDAVGARDGVDALEKLRGGRFDVIITDIAMPRMDGVKLLENVSRDEALAKIPVIVVSTAEDPETRKRVTELGAKRYIQKSSFDQDNLILAVKDLLSVKGTAL